MSDNPKGFSFNRNLPLLSDKGSLGFEVSSQVQSDVLAVLKSETEPFPSRDIDLAEAGLQASTNRPIVFALGSDEIHLNARGSFHAGFGVYRSGRTLLQKLGGRDDNFSLNALEFGNDDQSLLSILRWGYAAEAKASGAMALGPVGRATLSVSGNDEGLFAIVRRLPRTMPARKVIQETADSWMLPRQITSVDQVEPGTWIVAEVIGGIQIKLGAQLGYDFNWVREAKLGGLSGDIGLRLQMGIHAAVGFSASGRCAVVVSREADARSLRLRVFRLQSRGLDLSFGASLDVQAVDTLLADRIDDFIAAVFDTHGQQVLRDLRVLEKWTDPNTKLSVLLAGAGLDGAERLIAHLAGVTNDQLQGSFDDVHSSAVAFIQKWHDLPHAVSSTVLKLVEERVDLADVRNLARQLSRITSSELSALLNKQLSHINFFTTPTGRLLESVSVNGVLSLLSKPIGEVQEIGKKALAILDGSTMESTLRKFQSYIETELNLGKALKVVNDADFVGLDGLLKRKLADFLDQDNLHLQDLDKVRKTIKLLRDKQQEYYGKAIEALNRKYNFALNAAFQSRTNDRALFDATFDFSNDPAAVSKFFQQAVRGNLDDLFMNPPAQLSIALGTISHGIQRQIQIDVTLPFMNGSTVHRNEALASVDAVPNGGGLLFKLTASDTVTSNQRQSILSIVAGIARAHPGNAGVVVHQDSIEMNYTLLFARQNMQLKHVRTQIGPAAKAYFAAMIPDFTQFLGYLDRHVKEAVPNNPDVLGNGLIALQISLSGSAARSVGKAWLGLPTDRKSDVYLDMSNAIQVSLKRNIHDSVFNCPEGYTGAISAAQAVLAYCAIVPRAPKVVGNSGLPFWDFVDLSERRIMLSKPQTLTKMKELLTHAQEILKGDPGAQFFDPNAAEVILGSVDANHPVLRGLLFAEAEVIKHSFDAGIRIAASQTAAPSEAVKALAAFGSKLTEAFNADITTLLGPGIQSLGTRVFLETSRAIGPALAGDMTEANAMMNVEFLKPDIRFDAKALLAAGRVGTAQLALADRVIAILS